MARTVACLCACVLAVLVAGASAESRSDGAFVILSRVISGDLVQGTNFTVSYEVHNVGEADATNLQLRDTAFPASRFTAHSGTFRKSWSRLNAGENATLAVVAEPKRAGELLVNPAALTYKDGGVTRTTRLAGAESMVVEDLLLYRRRTDTHGAAWATYGAASAVAIAAPYLLSAQGVASLAAAKKRL